MSNQHHFTTRRGFLAAAGFGGTALYGLWVGYGAAPGPLALFGVTHTEDAVGAAGQGTHADQGPDALTPEAFEARLQAFIQRFGEADGSVRPLAEEAGHDAMADQAQHDPHARHAPVAQVDHGDHGPADHGTQSGLDPHANDNAAPIDIWLQAAQFNFEPWHLRLEVNQPYRFRMMATDVAHGASIQFGRGGRMIRLRPGLLVETEMRFRRAGDYLIYCTVYCGAAHDAMQARLSVTEGGAT
ncbi:MAG: hypothetical protein U0934_15460 [Pseudotabrizicola sp.]|uniref:hypothetical protein n=1 Tax=Pseudotabrizicola sp. TaxID=2939647 RepID=UPI00272327DF|nr:hypothetical protein [Pseudotabrizicola sp.]MDO8884276.1 hypothetical protein [Pseudotabrizicola sp.]MDP2080240.1 hypothetical protein [Pseudotabrizicola sp.]MDZ7575325.1 hypothetical protein [Pseudotabrizicola sp.]